MIKLIRWLLGLCNHTYDTTTTVPVYYQGNEGNMLDIDMAFKGVVKYYAHRQMCTKPGCRHIRVIRTKD